MGFIGVSTSGSSIMKVFPKWSEILGLDAELFGIDVAIDANKEQHRDALKQLRDTANCQGALVTTHKISVYKNGFDLFENFDNFACLCKEVSAVKVRNGKLYGSAKDPITAGLSIEEFLANGHFSTGAEVLCFGDGGAATAIGWYLASRVDPPNKMTFIGIDQLKLDHLTQVIKAEYDPEKLVTKIYQSGQVADLLKSLPEKSLIINATGMGKDRPGSPVPAGTVFKNSSIVWELNYRGSLEFFHHAKSQQAERNLKVVDGWRYFIHGWSQVIAEVFEIEIDSETLSKLAQAAEEFR